MKVKIEMDMNPQPKTFSVRMLIVMLFALVVIPFLPLLITGRWDWWEAWIYAGIWILGAVGSRALAARRHPDLIVERSLFMRHKNEKPWDRILSPLVGLGGGLIPLVAGLEARFDPSFACGLPIKIVSLAVILAGYSLASYALIENRFFSALVRIQTDRGHRVVSSGPYRWLRHPGYAGALMSFWATPPWLDSWWAFIPAALVMAVLVIRTLLEDETLRKELDGYDDYARRVRYRLLPGVW